LADNFVSKEAYKSMVKDAAPKRPIFLNCLKAFLFGAVICMLAQLLQSFFIKYAGFDKQSAGNPTVAVLIIFAVILTGFGIYDKISQWAGAGITVPVTGFANSLASAAIEHRREGVVQGIGCNMFKIAGPVIVFGVASACIMALIRYVLGLWGILT